MISLDSLPPFFNMYFTEKDGRLSTDGYLYNDQLFQTVNVIVLLLNSLSSTSIQGNDVVLDGINPPSYTTLDIVDLEPNVPRGTIWYNSTLKKLQFKADDGVIETITSV